MTLDEIKKLVWHRNIFCIYVKRPYMEKCFHFVKVLNIRANQHLTYLMSLLPLGVEDLEANDWEYQEDTTEE